MSKYWIKKMSGCQFDNFFPIDFIQTKIYTERTYTHSFDEKIVKSLLKVTKGQDLSLYVVIVAAAKVLIQKLTGEDEVLLLSPSYSKIDSSDEFVILRDSISNAASFKDIVMLVKQTVSEAYANQDYSYKDILNIFDVEADSALYNLIITSEYIHNPISEESKKRISLCLEVKHKEDSIELVATYNSDVFLETTIPVILNSLDSILHQVLECLDILVEEIGIASKDDLDLLDSINGDFQDLNENDTIIKAFSSAVRENKDKTALVFKEQSMTYQELEEKSDELAKNIMKAIHSNNPRVGIMVERSIEMIVGVLAIMKAGGAYVPIDVTYPQNRVKYIIDSSECSTLLVQNKWVDKIPAEVEVTVIGIDVNPLTIHSNKDNDSKLAKHIDQCSAEDLAYIIFTSGTTGKAKGVTIEHKAIMNTLTWRKNYYQMSNEDCVLQLPSLSFDSSVEDIFTTIISGAKLVLIEENTRSDMDKLKEAISKNKVTHILTIPSYYKLLIDHCREEIKALKAVTLAGESFDSGLVKKHKDLFQDTELYNEYGPTENSVCTTIYKFGKEGERVLIGKPIKNAECFIIKNNNLLPTGIKGELCISGKGLSKGYYHNKELTNSKFIQSSISKYGKIYLTGDMARLLADGNIEYLGREDNQVKIRGFRIELGEIEAIIKRLPYVTEAVALYKETGYQDKTIYAFVEADIIINQGKLKEILSENLPYYMVPSMIIQVEEIPLNTNGKVDKKQLLSMNEKQKKAVVHPRTDNETILTKIWSEVIRTDFEAISIEDDFFEVGGHSINSVIILNKIREKFGVSLVLNDFLQDSSIQAIAMIIDQRLANSRSR